MEARGNFSSSTSTNLTTPWISLSKQFAKEFSESCFLKVTVISYTKQEKIECLVFTFAKNTMANPLPYSQADCAGSPDALSPSQTWCFHSLLSLSHEVHLVPKAHSRFSVCFVSKPLNLHVKNYWLTEFCTITVLSPSMQMPRYEVSQIPPPTCWSTLAFSIPN